MFVKVNWKSETVEFVREIDERENGYYTVSDEWFPDLSNEYFYNDTVESLIDYLVEIYPDATAQSIVEDDDALEAIEERDEIFDFCETYNQMIKVLKAHKKIMVEYLKDHAKEIFFFHPFDNHCEYFKVPDSV